LKSAPADTKNKKRVTSKYPKSVGKKK